MYRLVAILLVLIFTGSSFAQKITLQDRIIAEHIYNFGVFVTWKKNKSVSSIDTEKFNIGVLSKDTSMYYLLKGICKWRLIKWKKIDVKLFSDISDVRYVQVLYVGRDMNPFVPEVDSIISLWPTLLITDSCQNYSNLMINFFPKNSIKKVEINEDVIKSRGMKCSPLLFTVAKKYEEDWEGMFRESEIQLAIEKELVSQQQRILEEKGKEIRLKESQISQLSASISEKEKHLEEQKLLLHKSQLDLKEKILQISEKSKVLASQKSVIAGQEKEITIKKQELLLQLKEYEKQKKILDDQKSEIDGQQELINDQKKVLSTTLENMKKQQLVMYFLGVVILLIGVLAFSIYRGYKVKKKINSALKKKNVEIFHQKEEIQSQRDEIEAQRDEITAQRDTVINQKRQIEFILSELTDSIHYAGRIQNAILPTKAKWATFPFEHFVMYHPRDIISGDFYWFENTGKHIVFCVADCTGHGVPGAFMSMLGVASLYDALKEVKEIDPGIILDRTRDYLLNALQQDAITDNQQYTRSVKDGMDIALCTINLETLELKYAGANNPLYIVKAEAKAKEVKREENLALASSLALIEVKGDKMPIGLHVHMEPFRTHTIKLEKGDSLYIFSDGMADQFGGPKNKKFKYKQLKEILIANSYKPMAFQKEQLETAFISWKGKYDQMDDVTIMGVRV